MQTPPHHDLSRYDGLREMGVNRARLDARRRSASRLAAAAVEALAAGQQGVLVGQVHGAIATTPLAEVAARKKPLDLALFGLARVLAS